jgi:hypothetical protein
MKHIAMMVDEGMTDAQIAAEMNKSSYFKGTNYTAEGISKITGPRHRKPTDEEIRQMMIDDGTITGEEE